MTSPFRTILVPHDFSPQSDAAIELAQQLAGLSGARLHLVHAVETPLLHAVTPAGVIALSLSSVVAEGALLEAEGALRRVAGGAQVCVVEGAPRDVISAVAAQLPADLIVMGTHGREGLARAVLGSVAEHTVRHAPCPVLTVRACAGASRIHDYHGVL
jgi:nucleotide-binding universal stress UspA family protein